MLFVNTSHADLEIISVRLTNFWEMEMKFFGNCAMHYNMIMYKYVATAYYVISCFIGKQYYVITFIVHLSIRTIMGRTLILTRSTWRWQIWTMTPRHLGPLQVVSIARSCPTAGVAAEIATVLGTQERHAHRIHRWMYMHVYYLEIGHIQHLSLDPASP